MSTILFSLHLERGRDLLQARQRARQIASLLGFEGLEQTTISALVLAIAIEALSQNRTAWLQVSIVDGQLEIQCKASARREEDASNLPFRKIRSRRQTFVGPLPQFYPGMQAEVDSQGGLRRLTFALPDKPPRIEAADLPWAVQELDNTTPLDVLEEFSHWNQEMLQLTQLARAYGFFAERVNQAA
jgi:hypothetical protein